MINPFILRQQELNKQFYKPEYDLIKSNVDFIANKVEKANKREPYEVVGADAFKFETLLTDFKKSVDALSSSFTGYSFKGAFTNIEKSYNKMISFLNNVIKYNNLNYEDKQKYQNMMNELLPLINRCLNLLKFDSNTNEGKIAIDDTELLQKIYNNIDNNNYQLISYKSNNEESISKNLHLEQLEEILEKYSEDLETSIEDMEKIYKRHRNKPNKERLEKLKNLESDFDYLYHSFYKGFFDNKIELNEKSERCQRLFNLAKDKYLSFFKLYRKIYELGSEETEEETESDESGESSSSRSSGRPPRGEHIIHEYVNPIFRQAELAERRAVPPIEVHRRRGIIHPRERGAEPHEFDEFNQYARRRLLHPARVLGPRLPPAEEKEAEDLFGEGKKKRKSNPKKMKKIKKTDWIAEEELGFGKRKHKLSSNLKIKIK